MPGKLPDISEMNTIVLVDPRVMSGQYLGVVSHELLTILHMFMIFIFTLINEHLQTTDIKQM